MNGFNSYTYTKDVVSPEALRDLVMIRVSKELWRKINDGGGGIIISPNKTGEQPSSGNVVIFSVTALTSDEQDEITLAINEFNNSHEFAIRSSIEIDVLNDTASFGQTLMEKIAANNVYQGKHLELSGDGSRTKTRVLIEDNVPLIISLLSGSLGEAYYYASSYAADEIMSQAEIDEYKKRLELKLGL